MTSRPSIAQRIADGVVEVPFCGCHIWTKSSVPSGYGVIWYKGRQTYVHRVVWELKHGQEVPADMYVCHTCDTPACVNPAHLFIGTPKDNVVDMHLKGRARGGAPSGDRNPVRANPSLVRGENSGAARLTVSDIDEILRLYSQGMTQVEIAPKFGVNRSHISRIVRKQSWSHV